MRYAKHLTQFFLSKGVTTILGAVIASLTLLGSGNAIAAQGKSLDKVKMMTAWFASEQFGGYYSAKALGIYEKYGLDVTIESGGPQIDVVQILAAGNVDFVTSHDIKVLMSAAKGLPVVAVGTSFQKNIQCIMTHKNIKSLEGLNGNSLFMSTSARMDWWPWLKNKFQLENVDIRPYTGNLQPFFANENSAIQAYVTVEPNVAKKNNVDVNVFTLADYGYPAYTGPILTTTSLLKKDPDLVKRFLTATMQGWREYLVNPDPADKLMIAANPNLKKEDLTYALNIIKEQKLVAGGDAATKGIGIITKEHWEKVHDMLVDLKLMDPKAEWRNAFSTDIIDQVKVFPTKP